MEFDGLQIAENEELKCCKSSDYNFIFNKKTGFFARWGRTEEEDPQWAPSAELLDIEITTICHGIKGKDGKERLCNFCYKSNTPNGKNMSFGTFKKIFKKFNKSLTQVALGLDSHATSNPDTFKIMRYCRDNNVIPNLTVAQIDDETADKIVSVAGACAVSRYEDKDICYDSVRRLTDRGLLQTNIHFFIHQNNFDQAIETLNDILIDERLKKLHAIVFLSLKKCGRGINYTQLSDEKFRELISFATKNNIRFGFDSCSAFKYLKVIESEKYFGRTRKYCEPCEATLFSSFVNVDGFFTPCSFSDGTKDWEEGLDVINCNDFIKDIWMNEKTIKFRKKLLNTENNNHLKCRECPIYKI